MMSAPSRIAGFTLVEVLVATMLLVVVAAGVAHLFGVGIASGRSARAQTMATILASAKLEQLRSLTWAYEPVPGGPPLARSDATTNLSVDPPSDDGPGLGASPPGTLESNLPPYVDFLDAGGRWVGTGSDPPRNAAFIRRWSVRPLPDAPDRTLVLQVLVTTTAAERRGGPIATRRKTGEETVLVTVKTRKGT